VVPPDVQARLDALRERRGTTRAYALVDGLQYQQYAGKPFDDPDARALFEGTPEASLAYAGPWLVDVDAAAPRLQSALVELERERPAVVWVLAGQALDALADALRQQLEARLADGKIGILRFWDPRVLGPLAQLMSAQQRETFFLHSEEWHFLQEGNRVWIGRHHADT
jgi:hypothetical protein